MNDHHQHLRLIEALLFASAEPLDEEALKARLPEDADMAGLIAELAQIYANRGVHLVEINKKWAFRTAPDLAAQLRIEKAVARKLNRAAVEALAIIAYHQPITRPEIEEIRGVSLSKGTLDVLLEAGWIKPGRRREGPGRPLTWVTTEAFLDHFGLANVKDLPGVEELKAAGLLDKRPAITAYGAALTDEQIAQAEAEREAAAEAESEEPSLEELAAEEDDTEEGGFEAATSDEPDEGDGEDSHDAAQEKAAAPAESVDGRETSEVDAADAPDLVMGLRHRS